MTRAARTRPVFLLEEPVPGDGSPRLDVYSPHPGVSVGTPIVPHSASPDEQEALQRQLLDGWLSESDVQMPTLWYYTPMALPFSSHIAASAVVYDCMDDLSGFAGASPRLKQLEGELMARSDVMFTGGHSLYDAKRHLHANVHAVPSSVDVEHFGQARILPEAVDQRDIPSPRLGYCGVIDERIDLELIAQLAEARPDWHLVLVGPVTKIDPDSLPRAANIHYMGARSYAEIPSYLAGWAVALLPFAHNAATRFISPTKTPEYLSAGCQTVSTSVRDVVRSYATSGLVRIADGCAEFVAAIESALADEDPARLERVDRLLADSSWDRTWDRMQALMDAVTTSVQPVEVQHV